MWVPRRCHRAGQGAQANHGIEQARSVILSRMTTSLFQVMAHVLYCTRHLGAEVDFTCNKSEERHRQFAGRVFKALAAMAHAITRRHREGGTVAFGNANPGHGSVVSRVGMGSHKGL